ncbi:unnamed protein product, partial [Timema podura]|nr:unnamed protein product [Timema podura]
AGKLLASDLEPALSYCTHLVYGYAKIDETTFKLTSLDEPLDLDSGRSNYHAVTNLKKRFPGLHVLLAVGGPADIQDVEKYLTLNVHPRRPNSSPGSLLCLGARACKAWENKTPTMICQKCMQSIHI